MTVLHSCPECRSGKHRNCDGSTWDNDRDLPAQCPCSVASPGEHPGANNWL